MMTHDHAASKNATSNPLDLAFHTIAAADQLAPWLADWERLTARARRYIPSADDLRLELSDARKQLLVAVIGPVAHPDAMVVFVIGPHCQRLSIGERNLADLQMQAIRLLGCAPSPDHIDVAQWRTVIDRAAQITVHDAIDLGEVAIGAPLDQAFAAMRWPYLRLGHRGKPSHHWTIELPLTFDAYLAELRSTTRKSIRYYQRRLAQSPDLWVETISTVEQIEPFLAHGEAISRRTFQWHVGQRLENDAPTRARYYAAAEAGRLRCYLLYLNDCPIAFARGFIGGCAYHYETPGFLVEHGKLSPGLTLLAYAIGDIIENKCCPVFDFGTGGDMTGYKERLGTVSVPSRDLTIFNGRRAKGLQGWLAGTSLTWVKTGANALFKNSRVKSWIKARLRKYEH
jgi:CelD/BcsL family acetyltransferase involved in cellulose biosynthesis